MTVGYRRPEGDTLVIRNTLRTHRLDRSEITTIRTGQRLGAALSTFEVQLTDHTFIHLRGDGARELVPPAG